MNNPMQILQMIKKGNPQQIIQQLAGNNQMMQNPMFKNAMGMYQKHDTQGLQSLVENMCKERGTTVDEIKKQLGI